MHALIRLATDFAIDTGAVRNRIATYENISQVIPVGQIHSIGS